MIQLPPRGFYSLDELARDWRVDASDIWHCLISGKLAGHVRIPLTCVFCVKQAEIDGTVPINRYVTNWEGYAGISRFQCQRFYERGELNLREFICEQRRERYVLPDETDDLVITAKRFGILESERLRFEAQHGEAKEDGVLFDSSFRTVQYEGETYYFGDMQAAVLKRLYEAADAGEPWVNGKVLLHEIGSESFNLMSLFKKHRVGKELIVSDRRGAYRLST